MRQTVDEYLRFFEAVVLYILKVMTITKAHCVLVLEVVCVFGSLQEGRKRAAISTFMQGIE